MSQSITDHNVQTIQHLIHRKKSSVPYLATINVAKNVVTDQDHFPYNRYFRGDYLSSKPMVYEREAGYRRRHDYCYIPIQKPQKSRQPGHCYEAACSTIYPCYPEYIKRYADKEEIDLLLNRSCVISYR